MSDIEDFSLIVFTPRQFLDRLELSFAAASNKHADTNRIQVSIKFASTVEELVQIGGSQVQADYVAIFVDIKEGNNILRCQQYLKSIPPMFVPTRLCIVNGSCRSGHLAATKDLVSLCDQYRIPIINSEILDDSSCKHVAEQIIRIALIAGGAAHGMPVVIPTPPDFEPNPILLLLVYQCLERRLKLS
uniref:Ornithine carbamoyltransferase n=1 Tax=Lygus hesperus TaxID=30085 RepID=A0A0A9YI50_LYGHE